MIRIRASGQNVAKVADELRARLRAGAPALGVELVRQAQERIRNGGDSQHQYPDLWATKTGRGYRAGGQPLRDTGALMNGLSYRVTEMGGATRVALTSPHPHAMFHQHGFKTNGPNFIPLTAKARRTHRKGANPRDEGLELDVDYIMAWRGVDVPQRKIFNMAPENVEAFRRVLKRVLAGAA